MQNRMSSSQPTNIDIFQPVDKKLKGSEEGKLYQNLLISLFAKRGYELSKNGKFCDFSLGREIKMGKTNKFDDLVFQYNDENTTKNLIIVQIKHKQNDHLINSKVLSTEASKSKNIGGRDGGMCKDFNLQKYFMSYLHVKEELESPKFISKKIKYIAIFTNVGLNVVELQKNGFLLKTAPPDITELFSIKESSFGTSELYNYIQFSDISNDLKKLFKKSSDLHRLAREFAKYVVWENYRKNQILKINDESLVKFYHVALEREVIKKLNQPANESYSEAQFREDFVDDNGNGSKQELRDAIFEEIRELDTSKSNTNLDDLKCILKGIKFKVDRNFGITKQNKKIMLPSKWRKVEDDDIKNFLKCLVFIVNQPRIKELDILFRNSFPETVLKETSLEPIIDKIQSMGLECKLYIEKTLGINKKTTYKGKWISGEDIIKFIEEQKNMIYVSFIITAATLTYESEILQYGTFNECGKIIESLDNFLSSDCKIFCCNTPVTLFSCIKILQYLNAKKNYRRKNGQIFIDLSILKSNQNKNIVLNAFELESNNMLIIECRDEVSEQNIEEFYNKLSTIVKYKEKKKVILISEEGKCAYLVEKFRADFVDKKLFIQDYDSLLLQDFKPKEDPLKKYVLLFQGQKKRVSLATLTGFHNWDDYVNYLCQEGFQNKQIIDMKSLFKILHDDEVEIGSKPLGTSNLHGAYACLYEEINVDTLANKLSLKNSNNNTDYLYIISGITGSCKKEKINELIHLINERGTIKNHLENIDCEFADDEFKDENFQQLCHDNPEKHIFWISVNSGEIGMKFILQLLYNPNFYLKRKFKNIVITTQVQQLLIKPELSQIFLFYSVKDQLSLIDSLKVKTMDEKNHFNNNCKSGKIHVFTLESEAEASFQENCRKNETVHLVKFENDQFIWCNSHGSLDDLHNDDLPMRTTSLVDEDNLIDQIKNRKVVLTADDPGMGKTTTLTKLYESKYESLSFIETHWVIRMNLRDHLQAIRDLKLNSDGSDTENLINFLAHVDLKLNNNLAKNLLEIALDKNKHFSKPLLLAFDGYDEILDEEDRCKIISLLKFLKTKTDTKIWITTRLHYQRILERELSTLAVQFHPIHDKDKEEYIKKYLQERLYLILSENKFNEIFINNHLMEENKKTQTYTTKFLSKMKLIFKDDACGFMGTPLQLHLLLEGSVKYFKEWIDEVNDKNLNFNYLGNDVWEVYKRFIDRKYDIYFKKIYCKGSLQQKQNKFIFNQYNKNFAKSLVLKSKPKKSLQKFKNIALSAGIMKSQGSNIEFIHMTFRDYFAAKLFIHWIKKASSELPNINKQIHMLKEVLKKPDYHLIRTFMNIKLQKTQFDECLKQYGKFALKLFEEEPSSFIDNDGTALHIAVIENTSNIVSFLLNILKGNKNILKKFLFTYKFGHSALQMACRYGEFKIFKLLLDAARGISEDTLQEYIHLPTKKVSSTTDEVPPTRCTAFHIVIKHSKDEFLEELLKRSAIKLHLILTEDEKIRLLKRILLHKKTNTFKIFFKECVFDKDSFKQLLLYENESILQILHIKPYSRSYYGSCEIIQIILSAAAKIEENEIHKMLLFPERGIFPFNDALSAGNIQAVEIYINFAKSIDDDFHTLRQMLVNDKGKSALMDAATGGCGEIIKLLLVTARDLGPEMLQKIIFFEDENGQNAMHFMVKEFEKEELFEFFDILENQYYKDEIEKILEKMSLDDLLESQKRKLISSIRRNDIDTVKNILDRAKKSRVNPDEKVKCLLKEVVENCKNGTDSSILRDFQHPCRNYLRNILPHPWKYPEMDILIVLLSYAKNIDDQDTTFDYLFNRFADIFGEKPIWERFHL